MPLKRWPMLACLAVALCLPVFTEAAQAQQRPANPLAAARSWGYQLQGPDVRTLAASPYDVLVIDYSRDGSQDAAFTASDLAILKKKPDGSRRVVLSYMSIGEAEESRFYWNPAWIHKGGRRVAIAPGAPKWLDSQNGEGWLDNFKVKYWDPDWQSVIIGPGMFLDRIIAAGFDGVYLDIIDGFEFFETRDRRKSARQDMITFVERIAKTARLKRPDFLIVPQNGEELLQSSAYRAVVSAIGKEDIFYDQKKGVDINTRCTVDKRPDKMIRDVGEDLKLGLDDQITVLSVEYLRDDTRNVAEIPEAEKIIRKSGYIPYFADRKLRALHPVSMPPAAVAGAVPVS